jgi:hypothetical protein
MVEDSDAGNNGVGGGFTKGIGRSRFDLAFGMDTRALYDRAKVNAYGRIYGGLVQAC